MKIRLLLLTDSIIGESRQRSYDRSIRNDASNIPEDSAKRLCLHALVPPRVDVDHSIGCGEVEALSSTLEVGDEDLHIGSFLLELFRDQVACLWCLIAGELCEYQSIHIYSP